MEKIIKRLNGYSGSEVYLVEENGSKIIKKINNIDRNYERMSYLYKKGFDIPAIFSKKDNILKMEYLYGLDMIEFLKTNDFTLLQNFILDVIDKLKKTTHNKDYSIAYQKKLNEITDFKVFNFTKNQLYSKLPKILPQSNYIGDFSLDNIIFSNNKFYLIDCITVDFDSWIFDVAKIRQDLQCEWFIRKHKDLKFDVCLNIMLNKIFEKNEYCNNNYILIVMLLRIYPYSSENTEDRFFLIDKINKLWK